MSDKKHALTEEQINKVIGNAVAFVANEALVLAQFEAAVKNGGPQLWKDAEEKAVTTKLDQIVVQLGGAPKLIVQKIDADPPTFDSYAQAALHEVISAYFRARKSVARAHLFMTGARILHEEPKLLELPPDPQAEKLFTSEASRAFWEHAEAAYVRLASYWDRVGQVLDFAFFNIRQFERDGFSAVLDRIHANCVPMDSALAASQHWKRLRSYQTSEKDDGMKWLLRRRNIVIHSIHLHPISAAENDVFRSQYNHLDESHRNRLAPRAPEQEVELLYLHLRRAVDHFQDFLEIVRFAPKREARGF